MKCSSARWRLIRVGLGLGVGLNSGFWVSGFGLVAGLRLGRVRDSGRGSGFRCSSTRGPRASLGPESKLRTTPLAGVRVRSCGSSIRVSFGGRAVNTSARISVKVKFKVRTTLIVRVRVKVRVRSVRVTISVRVRVKVRVSRVQVSISVR